MTKKPRILITNDDGIFSPGLRCLWEAIVDFAEVSIVAPEIEKSGAGLGITLNKALMVHKVDWEKNTSAWKVSGTPADCVRMALGALLDSPPDLIISGINKGSNCGRILLYSGTVGGIIEGVMRNVPGIAFSCGLYTNEPNYKNAQEHILPIIEHSLAHPLPKGTLLNVNFPDCEKIKGIKLAKQGLGYWIENVTDRPCHKQSSHSISPGWKWREHDEHEESDVFLLKDGYATAVPIHINELTDHGYLAEKKEHFNNSFKMKEIL